MNKYFTLPDSDKILLIKQAAGKTNLPAEAIEKDLWVTVVLQALFSLPYANKLVFKGGTSLSKIWNNITRFSEDVDLAIDRSIFGEAFEGDLSKKKLKVLRKTASLYVKDVICKDINEAFVALGVDKYCNATPQDDGEGDNTYPEPRQIHVKYKSLLASDNPYIKTEVLIEISSRSLIEPTETKTVKSIISEQFPVETDIAQPGIITALPEKTFLEKAFLLHELFSTKTNRVAERKSRHLYDLEKMMDKPFALNVLTDDNLWETIAHHRKIFTPLKDVDYSPDIRDRIELLPPVEFMDDWRSDYEKMIEYMVYGDVLSFDELITRIEELQNRFRNRNT